MDAPPNLSGGHKYRLDNQYARLYEAMRWIGPVGSAAAALTFYWLRQGLADEGRLQVWLVCALTASGLAALSIAVPALANWQSKRQISVMSEVSHFVVGLVGGAFALIDTGAMADSRAAQLTVVCYIMAMTLGATLGLPSGSVLTLVMLVPMWLGMIFGLILAGQMIFTGALLLCAVLLAQGIYQEHLMWEELIELRAAARIEAKLHKREAQTDSLTGLSNRAGSETRVTNLISGSTLDSTFAVLYLDLDQFKPINDTYGHASGDEVLIEVGRRLRSVCRPHDVVARVGGDEFMVAIRLDEVDSSRPASLADRIATVVGKPISLSNGAEVSVAASIGRAQGTLRDGSIDHLVKQADRAMYLLKGGSN